MTPALQVQGVCMRFGRAEILREVSLAVRPGERVAVIGPNGAGKSTLFNIVSGALKPSAGRVLLNGVRIDGLPPYRVYRRGLARSFQVSSLFGRLSVFENLRCALLWSEGDRYAFWRRLSRLHRANARVEELLQRLGLAHRRDEPAMALPYAEQRALEVGMTLAGGAPVVLLDEPTAGMACSDSGRFMAWIAQLMQGRTLLMVEHDMAVVFGIADRVAVLSQGELIAFDTPQRVRADARVQEAYLGVLPARGADDAGR